MKKFEYFTKYISGNELDTELKAFGDEGYELIYIMLNNSNVQWFTIFKKEINEK